MDSQDLAEEFARQLAAPRGDKTRAVRQATRSGQALITRIGNQSNLILDPDLDSYYDVADRSEVSRALRTDRSDPRQGNRA